MKYIKIIFCLFWYLPYAQAHPLPFNKVVIWGHKLHTHTHSYVHFGFYRAFKHLGYDTYWFDDKDRLANFDFSNSLFITEGQVDRQIPLRSDCRYILHNCFSSKYNQLIHEGNVVKLECYYHKNLIRDVYYLDDFTLIDIANKTLMMPWATDLLPHEIDAVKSDIAQGRVKKNSTIYFVGSIGAGNFGNIDQINPFKTEAQKHGYQFIQRQNIDPQANITLIQESCMAPAIQGWFQVEAGYIPCRIFKNISYGQYGITNSDAVNKLFGGKLIYNVDTKQLFYDAMERLPTITQEQLFELMDLVRDKHTYLNRIEYLLFSLNLIKPLDHYQSPEHCLRRIQLW